jgi:uncharacterized Zn finger protein
MNQQMVELKEQTRKQEMLERAQKIVKEGKVTRVGPNHWRVQSSSDETPGLMYDCLFDTMLECLTCSCPHYTNRLEYCKHLIAVATLFEGGP